MHREVETAGPGGRVAATAVAEAAAAAAASMDATFGSNAALHPSLQDLRAAEAVAAVDVVAAGDDDADAAVLPSAAMQSSAGPSHRSRPYLAMREKGTAQAFPSPRHSSEVPPDRHLENRVHVGLAFVRDAGAYLPLHQAAVGPARSALHLEPFSHAYALPHRLRCPSTS